MDRPNRYDPDGLPNSFGSSPKKKPFSKCSGSNPSSPTGTMNHPSPGHSTSPTGFQSSTERDADLPKNSSARNTPSPPSKVSEGRDLPPPSLPIPIPQLPAATQSSTTFMPSHRGEYNLSVPVGRPPLTDRNRHGLSVWTAQSNPFLHPLGFSSPPPKSPSNLTTPAQSPTTPNRRMIFPIELKQEDGVGGKMPPSILELRPGPGFIMRGGFGGWKVGQGGAEGDGGKTDEREKEGKNENGNGNKKWWEQHLNRSVGGWGEK